jgi:hypothetical protein
MKDMVLCPQCARIGVMKSNVNKRENQSIDRYLLTFARDFSLIGPFELETSPPSLHSFQKLEDSLIKQIRKFHVYEMTGARKYDLS